MKYRGIEEKQARVETVGGLKKQTLHIFSCALLCCLLVSTTFANIFDFSLKSSIKRITSRWSPKQEDFGKIKFVNYNFNFENLDDGIFIVKSPFKNYYANNISKTELEVFGLGDPIVLSPIDGKIESVKLKQNKYAITITNGKVKVELSNLNFVCINQNDVVKAETKIAVSESSKILFRLMFDGEYVELPASRANTTFFE